MNPTLSSRVLLALLISPLLTSVLRGQSGGPKQMCCPVLELRQYTLYPGKRDVLIELFDREFVESQEATGARIVGQFRDLDNPDRFVWLRGFADMNARQESLQAFYGGPVWKAHREEANATMADSSNVLLLRMAAPNSGFTAPTTERPPVGSEQRPTSLVVATIYYLKDPVNDEFDRFFEQSVEPLLRKTRMHPIAYFETETAENNFPKLPVRTGENVFIWFASFHSVDEYSQQSRLLEHSKKWQNEVWPQLSRSLKSQAEHLRLQPTARSFLK